jgi:hypothetical protein
MIWTRCAALAALLTILSGCATTTGSSARSLACGAFEPIRWADADTDETIRQVKAHNAAGRALGCWE